MPRPRSCASAVRTRRPRSRRPPSAGPCWRWRASCWRARGTSTRRRTGRPSSPRRSATSAEWTDGRYPRIIAPLGKPIEGARASDGKQVGIPALSRGTSEQLYLALRFGLVEHFVETSGEPLPIVMDDILVNFDDDRAARAARSIEALAQTCQVIYFTCHPTTPLKADKEETIRVAGGSVRRWFASGVWRPPHDTLVQGFRHTGSASGGPIRQAASRWLPSCGVA